MDLETEMKQKRCKTRLYCLADEVFELLNDMVSEGLAERYREEGEDNGINRLADRAEKLLDKLREK